MVEEKLIILFIQSKMARMVEELKNPSQLRISTEYI